MSVSLFFRKCTIGCFSTRPCHSVYSSRDQTRIPARFSCNLLARLNLKPTSPVLVFRIDWDKGALRGQHQREAVMCCQAAAEEVAALELERNSPEAKVDRQLTSDDARINLKCLYPN